MVASQMLASPPSGAASVDQLSLVLHSNRLLRQELDECRSREEILQKRLADALSLLEKVQAAEESLASQMCELEAESFEHFVESNRLVISLNLRLREKEKLLQETKHELLQITGRDALTPGNAVSSKPSDNRQLSGLKLLETKATSNAHEDDFEEVRRVFTALQGQFKAVEPASQVCTCRDEVRLERLLRSF